MRIRFEGVVRLLVAVVTGLALVVIASAPAGAAPASATASAAAGVVALATSPIDDRYNHDPALAKLLGPPTSGLFSVAGGQARNYKWGSLYWSSATGVHEVHGAIASRYTSTGGPSTYGFPTTDEKPVKNTDQVVVGAVSRFQKVAMGWSSQYGPRLMNLSIADAWSLTYNASAFGVPLHDQENVSRGGVKVQFSKADVYRGATTGVHALYKSHEDSGAVKIRNKYVALGSSAGVLGLPTGDFLTIHDDSSDPLGATQKFEFGAILLDYTTSGATPKELHGPIYQRWVSEGYVAGLGFPTSDVKSVTGGQLATFERGTISWNAATGKTTVTRY
jgi:uncharacterized protein with LGFP repeats